MPPLGVHLRVKEVAMEFAQLTADLTVAEVIDRWPETIPVFFRYRMACVGCLMAPFETLADVVVVYGLDLECFMNELQQTIPIKEDAHSSSV
jgi:hybrid cluster-associated redox disulfide protein